MCAQHMPQESERLEVRESAFGSLNSNARRFPEKERWSSLEISMRALGIQLQNERRSRLEDTENQGNAQETAN